MPANDPLAFSTMRTALLRLLLGAAASAALLAGCGGGDVSPNAGEVRLVNATGDTLDLYADSDRLSNDVAPSTAGNYEDLNKGSYTFSVRGGVAGATIATLSQTVESKERFSLVAYSTASSAALAAIDEEEDQPDKGSAKIRFFHTAAADSGAIDAYLIASGAACSNLSSPIASAVSDLQSTFIEFSPTVPAPFQLRLCITATNDPTDVRLAADVTIENRDVVTVVLSRTDGAVLLNGTLVVQDGDVTQLANAQARVRLAVGVTASSTVTASIGSTSLGVAAVPRTVTSYKLVTAGSVIPSVVIDATDVSGAPVTLVGGADYTLLVAGSTTSPTVKVISDDNSLSTNAAKPVKIRLLNGTNGATASARGPAMLTVSSTLLDGVEFGDVSPYSFVESSPNTAILLDVRTTDNTVLCTSMSTLPTAPSVFTVFTLGDPPAPGAAPICLLRLDR
jgi:hypothetical protein